ncbi:S24 family peptidase [Pseudopontixanthobacter vadosimaris]|uniref:S24 family peptidase n=1 Tax=Pseudopontixanthobacter vadosimaris TaxID=2726450 RepID=UPI0014750C83|nr:LexA family transcriptional regulator [Pseudopontixanthobacter vadosimaris]
MNTASDHQDGVRTPDQGRAELLRLAGEHNASLSALSRLIGRNNSYLQQYVRKGSPRKLEEEDRHVLAQFFGVPESLLRDAEEKSFDRAAGNGAALAKLPREGWVDIPRLPLGASAGPGAFGANEAPFDSFRFSADWLRRNGLANARLSAIAVQGDSMVPVLSDGDEILVDTAQTALRDGIHVVRLDDMLMVKRLAQGKPGRITLLSENPVYPPVEISTEDLTIVGRVVWKSGRL